MEGGKLSGDFSPEGVLKLQERMREKIRDLGGGFDDENLVEYVMVLLRNGRNKAETIKELHVFLESQSTPFVSWLWDYLASNMHLYSNEPIKNTENKDGLKESSRNRQKREIQKEINSNEKIFPLRSVVTHILHGEDKNNNSNNNKDIIKKQPKSPKDVKKRIREDDPQPKTRAPSVNVSRRLLQFAVRDAVKPSPRTNSIKTEYSSPKTEYSSPKTEYSSPKTEYSSPKREYSASKRIRSVVLASPKEDPRISSNRRSSRSSVFDRLTRVTSPPLTSPVTSSNVGEKELMHFGDRYEESKYEEPKYEDFDNNNYYYTNNNNNNNNIIIINDDDNNNNNNNKVEKNTEMSTPESESESENDMQIIMPDSSFSDDILERGVNVKIPPNEELNNEDVSNKEVSSGSDASEVVGEIEVPVSPPIEKKPKVEEEPQKPSLTQVPTSYTASNRLDDVDSRSVFITNVNFGATKDALSRHFNKFGAVLKVIILCDPTTGQPTGSACVEFLQKESAELALSVNGTSFMSRILKVVKKNSAEASQMLSHGGVVRAGSLSYGSYARGVASFRGRPPIRSAGRNFQWKRDTSSSSSVQPANPNAN